MLGHTHTHSLPLLHLTISLWCVMFFDIHTMKYFFAHKCSISCFKKDIVYIFVAPYKNQIQLGRSKQNSKYNFVVAINIHLCMFLFISSVWDCVWLLHGKYGELYSVKAPWDCSMIWKCSSLGYYVNTSSVFLFILFGADMNESKSVMLFDTCMKRK